MHHSILWTWGTIYYAFCILHAWVYCITWSNALARALHMSKSPRSGRRSQVRQRHSKHHHLRRALPITWSSWRRNSSDNGMQWRGSHGQKRLHAAAHQVTTMRTRGSSSNALPQDMPYSIWKHHHAAALIVYLFLESQTIIYELRRNDMVYWSNTRGLRSRVDT